MKVVDAAQIMGVNPQFLREWIKTGNCPFATAIKFKKWAYYIKFIKWMNGEL